MPAKNKTTTLALLAGTLMLAAATQAQANNVITVGAYHFPPVAEVGDNKQATGLLADLIQSLEAAHDDLDFRIIHTSPKRRHLDFDAGLYDVIFFESTNWGWTNRKVTASRPILEDEDFFIALNKPDRGPDFFRDLGNRRLIGIAGYHYEFANFETDTKALQSNFKIEFSHGHSRNLELIKADRPSVADVAIISRAYLQKHLSEHPEDRHRLLISDQPDQTYQLRVIAREDGPISASDLYQRMAPLVTDGSYQGLVEKWGLQMPADLANASNRR